MIRKEYSASAVNHPFLFHEFKKTVALLLEGNSFDDIRQMSIEYNVFSASTPARAKQIYNIVSNRVNSLNENVYANLESFEITTQKIINLISIMNTDTLFFDFVYEVYREKLILGDEQMLDSDIRIFFKNKQVQSERIASWKENTLKKLSSYYKTFLVEAGIAEKSVKKIIIKKPILEKEFVQCLELNDMGLFISVLMGVQ